MTQPNDNKTNPPVSFDVHTPLGVLSAISTNDPNDPNNVDAYPGIWIEVDGVGLVLAEFDSSTQKLRVLVWDKDDPDNDPAVILPLK